MADLYSSIEKVTRLTALVKGDMFALYDKYYDATSENLFLKDLSDKQWVVILRDKSGRLKGFTTVAMWQRRIEGRPIHAIFSGDTIVESENWGQRALASAWFRLAASIKAADMDIPLYWFLIVKGHRTYRYLPLYFHEYYPAHDRETPGAMKQLMDRLATERFGAAYDAKTGVIRFATSFGQLKPDLATIPEKDAKRAEVAFFLQHNPGYVKGEELVCLAEITSDNLRPLARRIFSRILQTPSELVAIDAD